MLSGNHKPANDILIHQKRMEVIKDCIYLGNLINNQGASDHEISCRKGKASTAFNQLNNFGQAGSLHLQLSFASTTPMFCLPYSTAVKPGT